MSFTKNKILITSAGSTNGINVIKALRMQKQLAPVLVAIDSSPLASGFYFSDKYYVVPKINSNNFVSEVLKICRKEKIDIIIPTFSKDLPVFAKNRDVFKKENIKMAISDYDTLIATEDKLRTINFFNDWGIPCPITYRKQDLGRKKINFPLIIKPVNSSGSKNIVIVKNKKELNFFKDYFSEDIIIQEYLEGDEYTIDGLCDLDGKMISASPRIRIETKDGLATKSITVADQKMVDLTRKIVENFGIIGPFNVQCFKNGSDIKFIEVNSRFPSGGLPLTVGAGFNIPLDIVKILSGKKINRPKIKTGLVMTRYWDSLILKENKAGYKQL